jgi:hypothetical protein
MSTVIVCKDNVVIMVDCESDAVARLKQEVPGFLTSHCYALVLLLAAAVAQTAYLTL